MSLRGGLKSKDVLSVGSAVTLCFVIRGTFIGISSSASGAGGGVGGLSHTDEECDISYDLIRDGGLHLIIIYATGYNFSKPNLTINQHLMCSVTNPQT